ncbi:MAG: AmmeMemoRadiSam system protein B [Candidatus Micrarchaeia archaeon]
MRNAFVAGQFYPQDKNELVKLLESFEDNLDSEVLEKSLNNAKKVLAVISPHAGLAYSGQSAAYSYRALKSRMKKTSDRTFAVFCPSHTKRGSPNALSMEDWQTPIGKVETNVKFAREMLSASQYLEISEEAHQSEHSLEVQLPFLQHFFENPLFAGVCISQDENVLDIAEDLANAVVVAEKKLEQNVRVIASSDFSHYEPAKIAKEKDEEAIKAICKLDKKKFAQLVFEKQLSICGFGPILVAMNYAKKKGAREGVLLDFSNSGKVTGENQVVDYASIAFV